MIKTLWHSLRWSLFPYYSQRRLNRSLLESARTLRNEAYGLDRRIEATRYLKLRERDSDTFESNVIISKAQRLAIEVPTADTKPSWWDNDSDDNMPSDATSQWLSEIGRTGVSKMIKEERRRDIEWWVKILTPLLATLITLLSLVIALISVSKK